MKYYGVTTTYNCAKILPYIMKYYEDWGYDKLIVYDNESTDNTVELLKQYPFVEIRTFSYQGVTSYDDNPDFETTKCNNLIDGLWDLYREHMKGVGYIEGKTELAWITLTDFDEVLYFYSLHNKSYHRDKFFEEISKNGYNVINENMMHLLNENFPKDERRFLHEQCLYGAYGPPYEWKKPLLIRLDNLFKINIVWGNHYAFFSFFEQDVKPLSNTKNLHAFHLKYAFGEGFYRNWYGIDKTIGEYMDCAILIKDYLKNKMLNGITPNEDNYAIRSLEKKDDGASEI